MTEKELKKLENDLIVATTMIAVSVSDEKYKELAEKLEKESLIKYESDINYSATNLLQFAIENEIYESAEIIDKILKKLNKNDK